MRRISFGARTYNASIGRFDEVDPLASIAGRFSPYAYSNNNPLRYIDPSGMTSEDVRDFEYSDGHSTQSYRNSTGSIGVSGNYSNSIDDGKPVWQATNKWNENYIQKYRDFVITRSQTYNSNEWTKFTCEDLALSLVVDFAYENNLPFVFFNGTGSYTSSDTRFKDFNDFKIALLSTSAASDIANSWNSSKSNSYPGNVILLETRGEGTGINHTQVIAQSKGNSLTIFQGNLDYRVLSNNPASIFYSGKRIEIGVWDLSNGNYMNLSKGTKENSNFLKETNAQFRQWNFSLWNNLNR